MYYKNTLLVISSLKKRSKIRKTGLASTGRACDRYNILLSRFIYKRDVLAGVRCSQSFLLMLKVCILQLVKREPMV